MQNVAPLVSVIVTCFNYGRYVGRAIESALAQTYRNVEIIVVNDGSHDDSLSVISRYAERVRLIDQVNQGSIAAYNAGFAASRGELIVLLDADDWLEPEVLERVVAVWSPEVAKVQWDLKIVDAQDRDLGRKFCNFDASYDAARVREAFARTGTYRWPVSVGNAYARWFAERVFPLSTKHGPDGALNTVAPLYGDVITIPEALAAYRVHGQNMWSNTGADAARLPERISTRLAELDLLERHAAERGVELPAESPIEHEIAFVNYRMLAQKLSLPYTDSSADSPRGLLGSAFRLLRRERYPLATSVAHAVWFGALYLSPPLAARELMRLRFGRGAAQGAWSEAKSRVLGRLRGQFV
jgi:glycosyltransferase involved in cell wall biosynthesis